MGVANVANDAWGGYVFDNTTGNAIGSFGAADPGIFNGDTQLNTQPGSGWVPAAPTVDPVAAANAAAANAAAAKAAADARTAQAINAGYDQVNGVYDRQLADLPGQIDEAGNLINSQWGSQKGSIDSGYDRGNANLQYARDDLGRKTNRSIQDLARSIRQSFDSFSTMIGSKGAGDSSATGQLSYALQKSQAENRSNIYQNQGDQLGQIAMKQGDLDAQHNDQIQKLNSWKEQSIIQIGQQFKAMQQQIEAAKAGASRDKLTALAQLNSDLVNQAIAALSGVEAQHNNTLAQINQSVKALAGQAPANAGALSAVDHTAIGPGNPTAPTMNMNPGAQGDSFDVGLVPYYKKLQPVV